MKIVRNVADIPFSPHRRVVSIADRKRREGRTVYNFSQGQPGLPPDEEAVRTFTDWLLERPFDLSKYTEAKGLPQLRQAVVEDLKHYGSIDVPPDQVVITAGALESLSLSLACLAKPGDSVLLLDPCYSVYWDLMQFHELKAISVSQKLENGFQPELEDIKQAMDMDIVAIVLCSPDNPTSRIISEEAVKTIIDGVTEKNIPLLYDEAYKHVLYEGKHVWIDGEGNLSENLISLNSFSKDLAIPGFRLGYMYGPNGFIEQVAKLKALTSICSPTPSQYMALAYFEKGLKERYLDRVLPIYRRRRDSLYQAISSNLPLARVIRPEAGMYMFPDMSAYLDRLQLGDIDFSLRLAEETDVITIPGSISGPGGQGHLRMCFVGETDEKLEKGVIRISEFIAGR